MSEALSIKDTLPPSGSVARPKSIEEEVATNRVRCYVDNLTGAVYDDATQCTNGCYQLVGEEAEQAIAKGSAPKLNGGLPQLSPVEQEDLEVDRRKKADADRAEAERKAAEHRDAVAEKADERAEAEAKAAGPGEDKARKQRPATKRR